MLILQAFIINGTLDIGMHGEHEDADEPGKFSDATLLKISMITTCLSIVTSIINNSIESRALQEPFLLYML